MYSLNDITNGCAKVELPEEISTHSGLKNQMVFTSEIPVVKEEKNDMPCSAVGHQIISLSQESGYQGPSLEEINSQSDVLNIQIIRVQGTASNENGCNDDTTGNQSENHMNEQSTSDGGDHEMESNFDYDNQEKVQIGEEYRDEQLCKRAFTEENIHPLETEVKLSENQSSSYSSFPLRDEAGREKNMHAHELYSHQRVPSAGLSHPPCPESSHSSLSSFKMSSQYPLPHQNQQEGEMPYFPRFNDSQSGSSYRLGTKMVAPADMISNSTVPLYHISVQGALAASQMGENAPYRAMDYQPQITNHFHKPPKVQPLNQNYDVRSDGRSSSSRCHCCCHSPSQSESFCFPASFGAVTQRPSVIMVPVSWSNSASGISHVPLKVNSSCLLHPQNRPFVGDRLGQYQTDSDSSDDDEDGKPEKYFRLNIDGTTARFKLTKDDWERIPINTFPSGGRLLSGDWTRIFLSKVKESNPWCSLRFKNNHVRSENSRKIHSAVFFRGGAECKRPECNVKVRFVIQKERGKYVDVTYVGDVCHSSEPGGSHVTSDKRINNRVQRTNSS